MAAIVEVQPCAASKAVALGRSTHVHNVRSLAALAAAKHRPSADTTSDLLTPNLLTLPDDLLLNIVSFTYGSILERHREIIKLAETCWTLKLTLKSSISALVDEVGRFLVSRRCCDGLLNLSGMHISRLECRVIARALSHGMLPDNVVTLWLQHNDIDTRGLRWLARGLHRLPATSMLSSISLGANAFHKLILVVRQNELAPQRSSSALTRALHQIHAAAEARGIKLRLNS